jgi:hypothetical protein
MKAITLAAVSAAVLAVPLSSFAQEQPQPVTHAQVASELAALERAGYSPRDWVHYPDNIQAAQRRVDAERAKSRTASVQ